MEADGLAAGQTIQVTLWIFVSFVVSGFSLTTKDTKEHEGKIRDLYCSSARIRFCQCDQTNHIAAITSSTPITASN